MFQYDFMQHAFLAGTFVAIMCAIIGVFVIARGLSFLTHAFSHLGFSGAAFAVYVGMDPLYGMLMFTGVSALAVGQMGVKVYKRDVVINVILGIFLGLGLLFLSLSSKQTNAMSTLLFGSVVGISLLEAWKMVGLAMGILLLLLLGYRMLSFDSFDPIGAEAAGYPVRFISVAFLLLLAAATAEAIQIVGALLVFVLTTIPASTARYLTYSVSKMVLYASLLALMGVWLGLTLAYYTGAPVSFYIAIIEALLYFMAWGLHSYKEHIRPQEG